MRRIGILVLLCAGGVIFARAALDTAVALPGIVAAAEELRAGEGSKEGYE
jgi:hypothetical protein